MGLKSFNNWINESENSIVNDDFARRLESDVKLLKQITAKQNTSRGLASKLIDVYGSTPEQKSYLIRIPMNNDLNKEINSLLANTEFDVVPDLVSGIAKIKIQIDQSLNKGSFDIKELYDWKDRHVLNVSANPENYQQLKEIVEKSIDHLFEEFKKVRFILPANIKRISGFADKIKANVKELYDNMIDEFYSEGHLPENLIEKDILAEIFAKTLLENPQYIEAIDKLQLSAKKRIFQSALKVFDEDVKIDLKTLNLVKSLSKAKKTWGMI
jgi:hypothetical protein